MNVPDGSRANGPLEVNVLGPLAGGASQQPLPLVIGERSEEEAFGISGQFSWLEEWDDAANLSQCQDDCGDDGEVDDHGEVVDDPWSKVFEMDRSNAIRTKGLEALVDLMELATCKLGISAYSPLGVIISTQTTSCQLVRLKMPEVVLEKPGICC